MTANQLAAHIEHVADTSPSDGMGFDPSGNQTQIVAQSDQLKWPDSYGIGASDGALYVTTSQLLYPARAAHRAVPAV
ncbi:MAG: hypothetical protein EOO56_13860 [Hymenobacter sp.]|nr:MAG: hypothetical protein EOO56_13860 [Hymenobacter sp.]